MRVATICCIQQLRLIYMYTFAVCSVQRKVQILVHLNAFGYYDRSVTKMYSKDTVKICLLKVSIYAG